MIIGIFGIEVLVAQPRVQFEAIVSIALDEPVLPIENLDSDRHFGFDIQVYDAPVAVIALRGIFRQNTLELPGLPSVNRLLTVVLRREFA
jgi:hypothetical protein